MPDLAGKKSLMTHLVVGYPSIEENRKTVQVMCDAGVDYIELQIPFSDPIADGKTIQNACMKSLTRKTSVEDCFQFAGEMAETYKDIKFLFMTYYNIVYNAGIGRFIKRSKTSGLYGIIVPELPPEEDVDDYYKICGKERIHPIAVFSPTTEDGRLRLIKKTASGFTYCTSRVGITGAGKNPHKKLGKFIETAKKIIDLPVAVGFGIDSAVKAENIARFADIVVIGSKVINIIDESPKNYQKKVYKFLYDVKKAISSSSSKSAVIH